MKLSTIEPCKDCSCRETEKEECNTKETSMATEPVYGFSDIKAELIEKKLHSCKCGCRKCGEVNTCICDVGSARFRTGVCDYCRNKSSSVLDETKRVDLQRVILDFKRNVKILYGVIGLLVVFITIGLWIIQNEMNSIRKECSMTVPRTLDIHNYGVVFNNSENKFYSKHKRNRRRKRESGDFISQTTVEKKVSTTWMDFRQTFKQYFFLTVLSLQLQ